MSRIPEKVTLTVAAAFFSCGAPQTQASIEAHFNPKTGTVCASKDSLTVDGSQFGPGKNDQSQITVVDIHGSPIPHDPSDSVKVTAPVSAGLTCEQYPTNVTGGFGKAKQDVVTQVRRVTHASATEPVVVYEVGN